MSEIYFRLDKILLKTDTYDDVTEKGVKTELKGIIDTYNSKYLDFKNEFLKVNKNVISLNITSNHFLEAKKEVKATARKDEVDNLNRYYKNPTGFKEEKTKA